MMLIFETEGFFEVDNEHVEELHRSVSSVTLSTANDESYELQALVCQHKADDEQRCHVTFFCRNLKRALVFAVKGGASTVQIKAGLEAVMALGFQMELVKLNLSPAMRQVVLRDIPGLQTPEQARRLRAEKDELLAEQQSILKKQGSETAAGKKAKLKINAEIRLEEKVAALRDLLSRQFAPPADRNNSDLQALSDQVQTLTERLKKAEAQREEERTQRELTEGIMVAAEKRIQELEQVLVGIDTKSADAVKKKQKIVQLESRIRELTDQLSEADQQRRLGHERQEQLAGDIRVAQQRIAELEKDLADATEIAAGAVDAETLSRQAEAKVDVLHAELDSLRDHLTREQSTSKTTLQQVRLLEQEVERLGQDLSQAREKTAKADQRLTESAAEVDQLQAELAASVAGQESKLQDFTDERSRLVEKIADLEVQLGKSVASEHRHQARIEPLLSQKNGLDRELVVEKEARQALQKQLDRSQARIEELEQRSAGAEAASEPPEHDALREELKLERIIRQRLEKGAVADQQRIEDLEAQLGGSESGLVLMAGSKGALAVQELELLKAQLQDALAQMAQEAEVRTDLEAELDEAHRMIETLEQAVKENRLAARATDAVAQQQVVEENRQVKGLEEKIKLLQAELDQERQNKRQAVLVQGSVEQRLSELEERLTQAVQVQAPVAPAVSTPAETGAPAPTPAPTVVGKRLPHELRPAPKKGAKFRPDWDLQGLPCQSVDQVLQAWESVFNVQLSLEGYPSQYCAAFLVLLKLNKETRLFLVFNLKKDKHVLVCVPAKPPADEASLKKTVSEGKSYLQLSGFEMEPIAAENLVNALSPYCLKD